MLESAWEQKEIEFDVDLEDTDFVGNESLLHHIWDNLISNAIKFSHQGGKVSIKLQNLENKVIFTISDNGIGISEEEKNHIFDKFYQADSSHKQEGNGLGLALVKKIVDIEGGEIFVQSNDECGCTFTVVMNK